MCLRSYRQYFLSSIRPVVFRLFFVVTYRETPGLPLLRQEVHSRITWTRFAALAMALTHPTRVVRGRKTLRRRRTGCQARTHQGLKPMSRRGSEKSAVGATDGEGLDMGVSPATLRTLYRQEKSNHASPQTAPQPCPT